jgi:ribosomal-protein-alanine N-acetyltransferase
MAQSRIIETIRLRILPFSEEFLTPRYVSWLNDLEVVRFSEQRHRVHTLESCREYMKSFIGTPNYFWAMVTKSNEFGHIGNMNAFVDINNGVADIGILIGERGAWRKGYGSEAWIAVCNYLLEEANIRKVTGGTLSINTAMLGVMHHAGMVADGHRTRQCIFEESEVDVVYAALFRSKVDKP